MVDISRCKVAFGLITQSSTISQVQTFLKSKNIYHSGGWQLIWEKRVLPALEKGSVTEEEVMQLLRNSQEYGRQHVFLYKPSRNRNPLRFLTQVEFTKRLKESGLGNKLNSTNLHTTPKKLEIIEIRFQPNQALTVVFCESREVTDQVITTDSYENGIRTVRTTRTFKNIRLIHVVEFKSDGSLVVRVGANSRDSFEHKNYKGKSEILLNKINLLVPNSEFTEHSLTLMKSKVINDASSYSSNIRIHNILISDDTTSIHAQVKSAESNLAEAEAAKTNYGLNAKISSCDSVHVLFLQKEDDIPARELTVVLNGQIHEFHFRADVSQAEYNHVCEFIRKVNK